MGYCEFQIPFFIEGVKVQTVEMSKGTEYHEEAERIERESSVAVPLTRVQLEDTGADLDFMREDIQTLFEKEFDISGGKVRLYLFGRADKVVRRQETLIISDDKHTSNLGRYGIMSEPYFSQMLQVLAYLNSRYYLGESFGGWSEIPHVRKKYEINIVDSGTKSVYKRFEGIVTGGQVDLFLDAASSFALKCLSLQGLVHHNSEKKCKACGYFGTCSHALR